MGLSRIKINIMLDALTLFKKQWIGKTVVVVDRNHPHFGTMGEVTEVERTMAGWGMKIKNTDNTSIMYGEEFYIFKGNQIKVL